MSVPGTALWRSVPSVSVKFLAILVPILAVCSLGFSFVFFLTKHQDLVAEQRRRMTAIADINAKALVPALWALDDAGVRNILQAIAVNPEVRCVDVTDTLSGTRFTWPPPGCDASRTGEQIHVPLRTDDGPLGRLTLGLTHDTVNERIRADAKGTMQLLLLILAGTVTTALVAHRLTIVRPLHRLIAAIARADTGQPVEWRSSDELGRVIAAYNAMLMRLHTEEEALRQSRERLALAIGATRSAVWDHDLVSGRCWWSPEFPRLLRLVPGTLPMTPEGRASVIHPEDIETVRRATRRHILGETDSLAVTYRARMGNGAWLWLEENAIAARDSDGVARRLTGTVSDVTERIMAQQALARERNTLQVTLDNVDQGIIMANTDLRVVMSNRRAAELLNVPGDFLATCPDYPAVVQCQRDRGEFAEDGGDPDLHAEDWQETARQPMAFKRRRSDGAVIEVRSNPLPGGGFVRTFSDVTVEARSAEEIFDTMLALESAYADLKEAQASLVQAEKMASLALLVAGVAHEINTPVGIAYGCSTHLTARTRAIGEALADGRLKKSDLSAYLNEAGEAGRLIHQNLGRAADLIQSFKRVAVDQTSQDRRSFDLGDYLTEIVTSLAPSLRRSRHTIAVTAPAPIIMDSYPGALSQIITNFVMNAEIHAFDEQTDGHMTLDASAIAGDEVEIRFSDDGRGIRPDHLPRVFDPFFTTKRGEGGSGLGLHIVFNLVTQTLGGRITVDSPPGQGTTFTVRIPRAAPMLGTLPKPPVSRQPDRHQEEQGHR